VTARSRPAGGLEVSVLLPGQPADPADVAGAAVPTPDVDC
jgi:hypothetical protein